MTFFSSLRQAGVGLLGVAALAVIILLEIADPAPLARVRMQVFDAYQQLAPRETAPHGAHRVAIVDIDEASIDELGQWPWARSDMATLTERLGKAGASAVVFDVVFSEPDRTSPEAIANRLNEATAQAQPDAQSNFRQLAQQLRSLPSHDARFAASFESAPVVTGFFLSYENVGRPVEPKANFTLSGTMPTQHVPHFEGAIQPLPLIEQAAAGNGFVSLESDADGIVRRVPLVAIHRDTLVPSLSLEALRIATNGGSPNLLTSDGTGETLGSPGSAVSLRMGETTIPVNDAGEMWLHYPEPGNDLVMGAAPIITGNMSDTDLADNVAGKIVFIGGSAAGLQDLVSTPVSERIAGVTVHASAIEQMLSGQFIERPDWAFGLELLSVLILGLSFATLLPRVGALRGAAVAAGGIGIVLGVSWLGFTQARYLFDPTYPVLTLIAVYAVQTVAVYYREERKRQYIHSAFDRYLSPELVQQIAENPDRLELGGEEREMSVMMCDIRGFSRISERYTPHETIDFLIEFLTPMSNILMENRATLDKYIGDAILAFWNAPLDDTHHHRNAARAALAMSDALIELNRVALDDPTLVWPGKVQIGIGLNSGPCCVGNMGSRERLSYSLIGDTVNVAARLEGLTKQYGVQIIIGENLARELDGFALMEIDQVRVVGRNNPERIYALLGDEEFAKTPEFLELAQAHAAMLEAYRAINFDRAEEILFAHRALYARASVPTLALLFESRAAKMRINPPAPGWDGVFAATEK